MSEPNPRPASNDPSTSSAAPNPVSPSAVADEHLPTTRLAPPLPPIAPPPPPLSGRPRPASYPPPSAPLAPTSSEGGLASAESGRKAPARAAGATSGSWWTTLDGIASADLERIRRQVGLVAAVLGVVLSVVGVVLAFRGAPAEGLLSGPTASLAVAHTLASLALIALGWGLVRLAERAFFPRG